MSHQSRRAPLPVSWAWSAVAVRVCGKETATTLAGKRAKGGCRRFAKALFMCALYEIKVEAPISGTGNRQIVEASTKKLHAARTLMSK